MVLEVSKGRHNAVVDAVELDVSQTPAADPGGGYDSLVPTVLAKLQKWGDYDSCGAPIRPSKFIPMKTPMGTNILSNWTSSEPPKHKYTVQDLLLKQQQQGLTVGLIIDLTNHNCLYTEDIPAGLAYKHISLVAKQLPSPQNISEIAEVARQFWAEKPAQYIAVHCSYGFNRTGFVMCCCMVELFGMSIDSAIEAFSKARPPGIKHEKFLAELRSRYQSEPAQGPLQRLLPSMAEHEVVLSSTSTISRQMSRQLSRVSSSSSRPPIAFATDAHSSDAAQPCTPSTPSKQHPSRPPSAPQPLQENAGLSSSIADIPGKTSPRLSDPEETTSTGLRRELSTTQYANASPLARHPQDRRSGSTDHSNVPHHDSDPEHCLVANEDSIGALMSTVLRVASSRQLQLPGQLLELQQGCWQQTPSNAPSNWHQTVT